MSLFKSRFAKLESYVTTKESERTPDMLQAAQRELDAAGAKLVLVPHSEGIASPEQLDKHIEDLRGEATTAKAEAKKATDTLAELRGKRVLDSARETADDGKGGDDQGTKTAGEKQAEEARSGVKQMDHYQKAARLLNND